MEEQIDNPLYGIVLFLGVLMFLPIVISLGFIFVPLYVLFKLMDTVQTR